MLSNFGPSQGRKGLENGPIGDNKWLKNGSKPWFCKNDPSLVVVPERMNTTHFEPLLSRSSNFQCVPHLLLKSPRQCSFPTSSVPIFNPGQGWVRASVIVRIRARVRARVRSRAMGRGRGGTRLRAGVGVGVKVRFQDIVQNGQNFPSGAFGAHGASGAFGLGRTLTPKGGTFGN